MTNSTRSRRTLVSGLFLLGGGLVANALHLAGLIVLLPGLMLCVAAAALAASTPAQPRSVSRSLTRMSALRNPATITVSVLGVTILLPFVVVGALVVVRTDPLATFLIGLGLFALAGVLVATFLVVFGVTRWRNGHHANSSSFDLPS